MSEAEQTVPPGVGVGIELNETDLLDLAKGLAGAGVRLLCSGGTAKKIRPGEAGISIE